MNLYTVTFKKYNALEKLSIVATTPLQAIAGAKVVMKAKYCTGNEITAVEKVQSIDRVVN